MSWKVAIGGGTLALALTLSGCSSPSVSTSGAVDAQASAPTATTSTGATSVATAAQGAGQGNRANRAPNVSGTVQSINGSTITITSQQNNSPMTVQVTADTTIRKQVVQTLADVKPGTTVFAIGQQNGDVVQARQIRVGVTPGAGRPNGGNGGQGGNGTPRPAAAPAGITAVAGTVDNVSGDTVTVKSADGTSAKVQLLANGRVTAQETGSMADVTAGKFLVAVGTQQGTSVTATTLNVTDAPPGGGNDPNAPASG